MKIDNIFILSGIFVSLIAAGCNKTPEPAPRTSDTSAVSTDTSRIIVSDTSKREKSAADSAFKIYRVLATVTAIDKAKGTITIDHERMEGYMDAMEMAYKVGDPEIFERVAIGTEGHFTLRVIDGEGTIIAVHVHHK